MKQHASTILSVACLAALAQPASAQILDHKVVYSYDNPSDLTYPATRFAGWPANDGQWIWGNQVLVAFRVDGYTPTPSGTIHHDTGTNKHTGFVRTTDGGNSWTIETHPEVDNSANPGTPPTGQNFTAPGYAMKLRNNRFYTSTNYGASAVTI